MSEHVVEAAYRPIPEVPIPLPRTSSDLEFEDESVDLDDEIGATTLLEGDDGRIRGIHFILGCAVLLPWNAMITATPYFLSRLNNSPMKSTFTSYLSTSFTASGFVSLAYATATIKQTSNPRRILVTISWIAFLTALLALSTFVHLPAGLFVTFVLLNGVLQAAVGSYLQLAIIAVASLFGPKAMQALMSGQAAVGVFVSAVQVLSAIASTRSQASEAVVPPPSSLPEESSARLFFALSTVFLIVSAGANVWMTRLPIYKAVTAQSTRAARPDSTATLNEVQRLTDDVQEHRTDEKHRIIRMAKVNITYNIAVAYAFIVTLSVFPPITISVQPTNPATHPLLFGAIHFLVFNIGDFTGRTMCSRPSPFPGIPSTPPIINSDALFMLILLLFGLSGGYVSSMCMMSAPSVVHNPRLHGRKEDVNIAATVANFCLIGGLTVGSMASFAVRGAVCHCNPFKG
ncbi:nucleoside transporter-domain-containing protein [Amylocystis lapponica]|nr:nucleoside transporter-domain-containing protein [Amylocystis lapponica]